mmetsp:Transcript_32062/g.76203  ORF Transcript_32062/g.76203 Transcript_32062/m.76203 type:complete len:211 (-) Transcript_32062:628-1260(-)
MHSAVATVTIVVLDYLCLHKVNSLKRVHHLSKGYLHSCRCSWRAVLLSLYSPLPRGTPWVFACVRSLRFLWKALETELCVFTHIVPGKLWVQLEAPVLVWPWSVGQEQNLPFVGPRLVKIHTQPSRQCSPFLVLLFVTAACVLHLLRAQRLGAGCQFGFLLTFFSSGESSIFTAVVQAPPGILPSATTFYKLGSFFISFPFPAFRVLLAR